MYFIICTILFNSISTLAIAHISGRARALRRQFMAVSEGTHDQDFNTDYNLRRYTRENFVLENQIFCNRELNGEQLEAIGFDMDFTLAQYNEAFDLLAFNGAKQKLHYDLGYPKEVLDFEYSPTAFCRGLIIDITRGNILKVDRHKYVRKATHGSRELSGEDRKRFYQSAFSQMPTFTESNYVTIDTMFLLIDAVLFSQLVDLTDKTIENDVPRKSYDKLYKDIRRSVDLCHKDGVIKETVARNPSQYILPDPRLVPMLTRIKDAGKKVFLLTNSLWGYTEVVMSYLTSDSLRDGVHWSSLFDVVIVGAAKPAFLTADYLSLFLVHSDGSLRNLEDKDSFQLSESRGPAINCLQGGHWKDLHRLLAVTSGDRILYVGDHMYADILRSKRSLGWRTCLVVPELEHELRVGQSQKHLMAEIKSLRRLQSDLDEYIDVMRQRIVLGVEMRDQLQDAETKAEELNLEIRNLTALHDSKFNPVWGPMFKAASQDSKFAKQITDYACLYTSRASNLGLVSPNRPFRPAAEYLPHEAFFEADDV